MNAACCFFCIPGDFKVRWSWIDMHIIYHTLYLLVYLIPLWNVTSFFYVQNSVNCKAIDILSKKRQKARKAPRKMPLHCLNIVIQESMNDGCIYLFQFSLLYISFVLVLLDMVCCPQISIFLVGGGKL